MAKKTSKVIFTVQYLTKVTIFCCFDVCPVWPPQIFKVQAKISVQLVFPDYLSISYDYAFINVYSTNYRSSHDEIILNEPSQENI